MAWGKSDTAVEGHEVRKDEIAVEWEGREMRRIMWVEKAEEERVKEDVQEW